VGRAISSEAQINRYLESLLREQKPAINFWHKEALYQQPTSNLTGFKNLSGLVFGYYLILIP
jgi:hypothetical protein